jgi:hypothetical protein
MPLPEGYLPRKGDEILVRARVKSDNHAHDDEFFLEIVGRTHHNFFMSIDEIHSLHCRHWNEGDAVIYPGFIGKCEVIACDGDAVWIKSFTNNRTTVNANELEPYVEPKPDEFKIDPQWEADPIKPDPILDGMLNATPGSQSIVGDDEAIEG